MLAIQAERFEVLRLLLEMACAEDATNEYNEEKNSEQGPVECRHILMMQSSQWWEETRLEHSSNASTVFLVIQAISRLGAPLLDIDATTEAATSFTLQVADAVLDTLVRQPNASWTYYEVLNASASDEFETAVDQIMLGNLVEPKFRVGCSRAPSPAVRPLLNA
jgi:hypothetical protein